MFARTAYYRLCAAKILGVLLVVTAVGGASANPFNALSSTESLTMLGRSGFADPFVFHEGSYYYIFGTGVRGHMLRTRSFTSQDIERLRMTVDLGAEEPKVQGIWAFRVYKHTDGSFHAYATLCYGNYRTVVAHLIPASAQSWSDEQPIVSWRLDKVLVGSIEQERYAYDCVAVHDPDQGLFLLYSSGEPKGGFHVDIHIQARKMLDPANLDPSFEPRTILGPEGLRSEDRNPGYIQILEGAIPCKVAGKYLLFYSVGDFYDMNYKLGLAYSDTLIPLKGQSYRKVPIPDPDNIWNNATGTREIAYLLQSEKPSWPNYLGNRLCGPGIGNLVEIGNERFLVFHARQTDGQGKPEGERHLWRIGVKVNVSDSLPPQQWIQPFVGGAPLAQTTTALRNSK